MKNVMKLLTIILCLAFCSPALAQPGGGQGMGPGGGQGPMIYNPQTVTTIKGVLQQTRTVEEYRRRTFWYVKTDQGDVLVHLGPPWYLSQQQVVMKTGDTVTVTGSKVVQDGNTSLVAKEITVNGKTVKLRDDQGVPLWRGQGPMPSR